MYHNHSAEKRLGTVTVCFHVKGHGNMSLYKQREGDESDQQYMVPFSSDYIVLP